MPDPKILLTAAESDNDDPTSSAIWDTVLLNAKLIEIVSASYTGTIDVQGQMAGEGDVWHPATYQRKTDAGSYGAAAAAQVALTDDTQVDLFLVSEPWRNMRVLVERTAGAGTVVIRANGLTGGGVNLSSDINSILAALSNIAWVRDEVVVLNADFNAAPVTVLDLVMGAALSCQLGGVYIDVSDFTNTAVLTAVVTLNEGILPALATMVKSATQTAMVIIDTAIPLAPGDTLVVTLSSDNAGDTVKDATAGYRYSGSAPTQN